tara:strand:+ start:1140 stop:1679 length:540 start_codon:yes stop_codon:yes gene_type:complete
MKDEREWLIVGIITSSHGIKGELKVKSLSDFSERFTEPGKRWLQLNDEKPILHNLISGFKKPGKNLFIISLEAIQDRDSAERLKKYKLLVESNNIPKLQKEEFHLNQLLKLKVKIEQENKIETIGEVVDLLNENNNLLEIKIYENNKKILIPFVKQIIPIIDLKKNYILIKPPKGLLEL